MQDLLWSKLKNTKKSLSIAPSTTGVYIYSSDNIPIYIGKSVNLKARLLSHLNNAKLDKKEHAIKRNSDVVSYTITDNEFKALLLESKLIQKHKPKYNRIWKDDKSYIYIKITAKDEFPKIYPVRKENDEKSTYFGPFPSSSSVEEVLKSIRKIIPFCMRQKLGKAPCFYSKINLCNPCPSHISRVNDPLTRSILKKQYRSNIRKIIRILDGNTGSIIRKFYKLIKQLSRNEQYEQALLIRNKVTRFERYIALHAFSKTRHFTFNQSQKKLQSLLTTLKIFFPNLDKLTRIECYDASTLLFQHSTASMVVLTDGLIDKSQYRRFKIKNPRARSDFAMLQEALKRRFNNNWTLPNLIVVDGGKPQLRKCQLILDQQKDPIPLIGIAKHPDRLVIGTNNYPTLKLDPHNLGLNLMKLIRDESHRFANSYHKALRNKIDKSGRNLK